jgi:predicted ribosome quality control (RQC) complex YloA/Tae2 family protein
MFKNYYLFKKQVEEISPELLNCIVYLIYTVHKNELVFDLKSKSAAKQLIISINPSRPYIYLSDFVNYKSDKFNMFEMLYGQEIRSINIAENNKYVSLRLNNHSVCAYFYGPKPNIIIYDDANKPTSAFKSMKNIDFPVPAVDKDFIHPDIDQKDITQKLHTAGKVNFKSMVKLIFPSANNRMIAELCYRCNSQNDDIVEANQDLIEVFLSFYKEIHSGRAYIHQKSFHNMFLLLYRSEQLLNDGYSAEQFTSVNKAWKIFNSQSQKNQEETKLYLQINSALIKRRKSLEIALEKLKEAENIEARKKMADLIGNLILTNKHKVPKGAANVELVNIFSEKQEMITIKLNPNKTAVENATHYFAKYKNPAEKKQVLGLKKASYSNELNELNQLTAEISNADIKTLQRIRDTLINMKILQDDKERIKSKEDLKFSFKRLILENKWDIYIGKNNINNELLTFSFANKSDLWLHAQGVSGSHVVIKVPKSDSSVPKNIIEQAGQLAAANSKAKHSTTVPVIYTEVRYVNKIRKAPPGTVNVRNEKVIFVKPLNLNQ